MTKLVQRANNKNQPTRLFHCWSNILEALDRAPSRMIPDDHSWRFSVVFDLRFWKNLLPHKIFLFFGIQLSFSSGLFNFRREYTPPRFSSQIVAFFLNRPRADIREFTKPRRQRQRERHWTKELMGSTMAVHVRYNSWYISLPSSAKQQREMTKFCVVWRRWTTWANFLNFCFKFIAVFRI